MDNTIIEILKMKQRAIIFERIRLLILFILIVIVATSANRKMNDGE